MKHQDIFKEFAERLKSENIEYLIMRGYHLLPEKPDSDLDIVINTDQYDQVTAIADEMLNRDIPQQNFGFAEHCEMIYDQYRTPGPNDESLPNKCFRVDLYNSIFFKSPMHNYKTFWTVSFDYQTHVFETRIQDNFYYIPSPENEVVLTVLRATLDTRKRKFKEKYKPRVEKILKIVDRESMIDTMKMALPNAEKVYDLLKDKKYGEIKWDL